MKPFPPPELVWPLDPGTGAPTTKWHVYVLPDLAVDTELAELIETAQQVVDKAAPGFVTPVETPWLHATVHMIDRAASGLGDRTINVFAADLARELARFPPFTVTARMPVAGMGGVILDLDGDRPGEPWQQLTDLTGTVIRRNFGETSVRAGTQAPHISLDYCAREIDSGIIQGALRHARISTAPITVSAVHILEVVQHAAEHRYTWHTENAIPIPLTG